MNSSTVPTRMQHAVTPLEKKINNYETFKLINACKGNGKVKDVTISGGIFVGYGI